MRYEVTIHQQSSYKIEIEAEDEDEAEELVLQQFYNLSPMQKENFLLDEEITDCEVEEC